MIDHTDTETPQALVRLRERVTELEAIVNTQQGTIELLSMRGDLMSAHVENLIQRVHELESAGIPCTCGYGGQHEPSNERCQRNQVGS